MIGPQDPLTPQAELILRMRALLAEEPSIAEKSMFGGRVFLLHTKILASALKTGELLIRVAAERHEELTAIPGARTAVMGGDRTMGPGWIIVANDAVDDDEQLSFWIDLAKDHLRSLDR